MSLDLLRTGFVVIQMLNANANSDLKASHGEIFSSMAIFSTFHRNSRNAITSATRQPPTSTTKTPPTFSIPKSSFPFSSLHFKSVFHHLSLMTFNTPFSDKSKMASLNAFR
uniref:Ionotropic receptor 9 n=1 Tax=Propsilocerus akamusi TaxID=903466 RepID=A0A7D0PA16_9DIPT|nr:ionotropic receptor 9 [Propsilocerus akamusi]